MYVRFMRMVLKLFIFMTPYSIGILLPINKTGSNELTTFERFTMSNIPDRSGYLAAHLVGTYLFTFLTLWLMLREYKAFITVRQRYLLQHHVHHYSIMVREIPKDFRNDVKLKEFFEDIFPGEVMNAYMGRQLIKLTQAMEKHKDYVEQLEKARAKMENDVPEHRRPTKHKSLCCGAKYDVIDRLEARCRKWSERVQSLQGKTHKRGVNGFVTFRSKFHAAVAAQGLIIRDPNAFITEPAPEPRDVYWRGMRLRDNERFPRLLLSYAMMFGLTFFWTIPITFVSSLTTLDSLSETFPFLDGIKTLPSWISSAIQGFLPAIILSIFMSLVPTIIRIIVMVGGVTSMSQVVRLTITRYYFFQVINVFLVFTLSGAVLTQLNDIIDDPLSIASLLASSVPRQSLFFINYLLADGVIGYATALFRPVPLILWLLKRKLFRMDPEIEDAMDYDELYPGMLLYVLVVLVFCTISPLVVLFGICVFWLGLFVSKYSVMYVNSRRFETGGSFFPVVFNRMATCLTVYQLTMVGLFSLKESPGPAVAMIPLIILSFIFYVWVNDTYHYPARNIPLRLAAKETIDTLEDTDMVVQTAAMTFGFMKKAGSKISNTIPGRGLLSRQGTKRMSPIVSTNASSEQLSGLDSEATEEQTATTENSSQALSQQVPPKPAREGSMLKSLFKSRTKPSSPSHSVTFSATTSSSDAAVPASADALPDETSPTTSEASSARASLASNDSVSSAAGIAPLDPPARRPSLREAPCTEHSIPNCKHDMCIRLSPQDLTYAYLQPELRTDVGKPYEQRVQTDPVFAVKRGHSTIGLLALQMEAAARSPKANTDDALSALAEAERLKALSTSTSTGRKSSLAGGAVPPRQVSMDDASGVALEEGVLRQRASSSATAGAESDFSDDSDADDKAADNSTDDDDDWSSSNSSTSDLDVDDFAEDPEREHAKAKQRKQRRMLRQAQRARERPMKKMERVEKPLKKMQREKSVGEKIMHVLCCRHDDAEEEQAPPPARPSTSSTIEGDQPDHDSRSSSIDDDAGHADSGNVDDPSRASSPGLTMQMSSRLPSQSPARSTSSLRPQPESSDTVQQQQPTSSQIDESEYV
ncbi:hypothetical protein, variant [Capsaspora owczarzaki ATCC 30864]|nr:hypothetical protein, variant [Capsaspora owczarzaki ATCC 30864]|eukprot:XP_011270632.1 hypothetical protein, variant [Capsaspora owczarzaki ATCC 30864]